MTFNSLFPTWYKIIVLVALCAQHVLLYRTVLDSVSSTCGMTRLRGNLIVGGEVAGDYEFPWIVSLQVKVGNNYGHFCGGSVISDRWIITAAHCLKNFIKGGRLIQISAMIGLNRLDKPGQYATRYEFERAVIHEKYNKTENDIALLRTTKPISFKRSKTAYFVNSICLPPFPSHSDVDFPPSDATVIGWGATSFKASDKQSSMQLLKVTISNINNSLCTKLYKQLYFDISSKTLCYGAQNKDSCQGDSGGPLLKIVNKRAYLIGLVSFGAGCGKYPGVYTDVFKYKDWILSKLY